MVDKHPVGGKNPLPISVISAAPSGANSTASGPGLHQAKLETTPSTFTVQARDQFDNPVKSGGSTVAGKLTHTTSGESLNITSTDNGDGSYTCSYPLLTKAGKYTVVPTLNGTPVKDSPFNLIVNPGGFSLDNTLVSFETTVLAGAPAGRVQLVDSRQNHLLSGGDTVEADALPLSKLEVKVRDNKNGTYDLIYPPDFRGKYEVVLKINDKPAPGGPWSVDIKENPLEAELAKILSSLVPKAHDIWVRLLTQATPQERKLIIKELQALATKKPLSDRDLADLDLSTDQPTATLIT